MKVRMSFLLTAGALGVLSGCGSSAVVPAGAQRVVTTPSAASTQLPIGPGVQTANLIASVRALRDEAQLLHADVFGGAYWQSDRVKLAFTRDAEQLRDGLVRNFPRPELVDAVTVDFSFAHLKVLADSLTTDAADLVGRGVDLVTWGANPTTNRVEVGVHDPTPAVIAVLQSRYGRDALEIIDHPLLRSVKAGT